MPATMTFDCKVCGAPLTLTLGSPRAGMEDGKSVMVVDLLTDQLKDHLLTHPHESWEVLASAD